MENPPTDHLKDVMALRDDEFAINRLKATIGHPNHPIAVIATTFARHLNIFRLDTN